VIVTIYNDDLEVYEAAPSYAEEAAVRCVFCMVGEMRPQQVTVEKRNKDREMMTLIQNFWGHMCGHHRIQCHHIARGRGSRRPLLRARAAGGDGQRFEPP
jgi:hypothetical protein